MLSWFGRGQRIWLKNKVLNPNWQAQNRICWEKIVLKKHLYEYNILRKLYTTQRNNNIKIKGFCGSDILNFNCIRVLHLPVKKVDIAPRGHRTNAVTTSKCYSKKPLKMITLSHKLLTVHHKSESARSKSAFVVQNFKKIIKKISATV